MNPVEEYFIDLHQIHATGAAVPETSYYGTLEKLINAVGDRLQPRVRCVVNIANRGAGIPDAGLFTAVQFSKKTDQEPITGQPPERGVIEVKSIQEDVRSVAASEQVRRYMRKYHLVLVTNYRDFLLVREDGSGRAATLESLSLASDAESFWAMAEHPKKAAAKHTLRLTEFLVRVLRHAAPIATPEDVAWFLGSYARDARARLDEVNDLKKLEPLRRGLEAALGLTFDGEKGEHLFRSTVIQTLFYGVFSAWALWCRESPQDNELFDWRLAEWSLHVPMVRALFEYVQSKTTLERLNLIEPLDWTASVLNRVRRQEFFERFEEPNANSEAGDVVQYFYESFLERFDPELRKILGVWYTPPEVVKYMVSRVDTVLREELGVDDGLADPSVYVLDPCCGTGAFLVEVLRTIADTLRANGGDALVSQDLKSAAMKRVFGFEIMPAPFVIAHLQIGLCLRQFNAPLLHDQRSDERAAVYLTNALTGWESPNAVKETLPFREWFSEMAQEHDAAQEIKRDKPILVVLGNPPYNAYAGVSPDEEKGLVDLYKKGLSDPTKCGGWGIKKFNLDDLYVRFFRIAERRIAERTGKGIVCFISNHSYLGDPSFVVMRKRFLDEFDFLWFDGMNGDSRETGKRTPGGAPDPSVFSTQYHPVGIRVGTAIALMVRCEKRNATSVVRFRDFWGVQKKQDLLRCVAGADGVPTYRKVEPEAQTRFSFRPIDGDRRYFTWPRLVDIAKLAPSNGVMEKRGGALIDIRQDALSRRMQRYLDPAVTWEQLCKEEHPLTKDAAGFKARKARETFLSNEPFDSSRIRRVLMRPFDSQWCYHTMLRPLWNSPRPKLVAQSWEGNSFLLSRVFRAKTAADEGVPFFFAKAICEDHCLSPDARCIPLLVDVQAKQGSCASLGRAASPNLSLAACEYLRMLGLEPDSEEEVGTAVWFHALAIGFSSKYLTQYSDAVGHDWPRIPMPQDPDVLMRSAALGREIAALLDSGADVREVTAGKIRDELTFVGRLATRSGDCISGPDALRIDAGWGRATMGGVVMPGKGRVQLREPTPEERHASGNDEGGAQWKTTVDVYLNEDTYWKNIPTPVWQFRIGGYQVIKKWLSYREYSVLGREITSPEAREVTAMARRICALLRLAARLDANFESSRQCAVDWDNVGALV